MEKINKIKYQAVICATLGLKKNLSKYYWVNISSDDIPFHGVIEHTNFILSKNYHNNKIAIVNIFFLSEDSIITVNLKGLLDIKANALFSLICLVLPLVSTRAQLSNNNLLPFPLSFKSINQQEGFSI